jgi:hypothetical protein
MKKIVASISAAVISLSLAAPVASAADDVRPEHQAPGEVTSTTDAAESMMSSVYYTDVDNPHRTGGDVSSHGWWGKISGSAKRARIQMELYVADGGWRLVATTPFGDSYRPGGGSGHRANVRYTCGTKHGPYLWQSYAEADVVGEADPVQWTSRGQIAVACSPR